MLWDRPFGTARANGPFGIPSHLPIAIDTPNNGGSVVTAGGLVFIAAATDNLIRAIDIDTGETVWQDVLPAGGQANPMVYDAGGQIGRATGRARGWQNGWISGGAGWLKKQENKH